MSPEKVVAALSGGVDSSIAAALLQQQGYEVIGLTMRLWSDPVHASAPSPVLAARETAEILGIPLHVVDLSEPFRRDVVQFFLDGYAAGLTPNPCVTCNRLVKWGMMLEQARSLGASFLATGHYARKRTAGPGRFELLRAVDHAKDQTYVLHILTQEKLAAALFPVGEYPKAEIRSLARRFGLPTASRRESQDLCFLVGEDYRDFIRRYAPQIIRPGPIVTRDGRILGEHHGLAYYTIGQRKGLNLRSTQPLYVLEKQPAENTLVVGLEQELGVFELVAGNVNWISGHPPIDPFRAAVKTRYTAQEAPALVTPTAGGSAVQIRFELAQRDITPGQAAVIYDGERLLGGGLIQ